MTVAATERPNWEPFRRGDRAFFWRVWCEVEGCEWSLDRLEHRAHAVRSGKYHANTKHRNDDEWRYRVQGVRVTTTRTAGDPIVIRGVEHAQHTWEPKLGSKNVSLPCGRCGIFRYVHAAVYGNAETIEVARTMA